MAISRAFTLCVLGSLMAVGTVVTFVKATAAWQSEGVLAPVSTGVRIAAATSTAATTPAPAGKATATPGPTAQAVVSATLSVSDSLLAGKIDTLLTQLADGPGKFSGAVLVARNGQPIFNKAYGMASYELSVSNFPEGKFRIASLTKGFVALAILQLQQQKQLSVKDSICKYLDRCPDAWQPITIHDLLSHQSGIPDYQDLLTSDDRRALTLPARLIDLVREKSVHFAPGELFEYSNTNYVILGAIVTKLAKEPFAQYLREHVLDPLGMADSGMDDGAAVLKNRVSGYETRSLPAAYVDMSSLSTAGGMYSTTEDLLRWDQALYNDKLLAKELLAQMFTPQSPPVSGMEATNGHYGYGWFIEDAHGRRRIGNGGVMTGFRAVIDRFPEDKVTVIILANREDVDPFTTVDRIEDLLFPSN